MNRLFRLASSHHPFRVPASCCRRLASTSSKYMHPLSTVSPAAVKYYDQAVNEYLSLSSSPSSSLNAALVEDPDFLMGHITTGLLFLLSTGVTVSDPTVAQCLKETRRLMRKGCGTKRERAFAGAFYALACGRNRACVSILEAILQVHPTDVLALRAAHDLHFFNGDQDQLMASPARVYREFDPSMPGYGYVCGMFAFGCEENRLYDMAEDFAMQAIQLNPHDVWALHALTHVYEMGCRRNEGTRLLNDTREYWEQDDHGLLLRNHIRWHYALFEADGGRHANAVRIYDGHMLGAKASLMNEAEGREEGGGAGTPPRVLSADKGKGVVERDTGASSPRAKSNATNGTKGAGSSDRDDTVLSLDDAVSLLWRLELGTRPLLEAAILRKATPSALVTFQQNDEEDLAGSGAIGAAASQSSTLPKTRWEQLGQRCVKFARMHINSFNDIHIAMAFAASKNADQLSWHLKSMQEKCSSAISSASGEAISVTLNESTKASESELLYDVRSWLAEDGLADTSALLTEKVVGDEIKASSASAADLKQSSSPLSYLSSFFSTSPQHRSTSKETTASAGAGMEVKAFTRPDNIASAVQHTQWSSLETAAGTRNSSASEIPLAFLRSDWKREVGKPFVQASLLDSLLTVSDEQIVANLVGLDVAYGMSAFFMGDMRTCLMYLTRSKAHWHRLGGSHAQRDVFSQTLIHAAYESGDFYLARSLLSERTMVRFADAHSWIMYSHVLAKCGEAEAATDASNRAYSLGLSQGGPSY